MVSHLPGDWFRWFRSRTTLKEILEGLSINCVLDVGANEGQFGKTLRQIGFRGWIISFEPVRANLEALKVAAAASEPWRVLPYALGASDGCSQIKVTQKTDFSSFLAPREECQDKFPGSFVTRTEEVEIWRLDSVFDTCMEGIPSPRIYMKLDTQGFDLEVARGAGSTLNKVLALQTEIAFRPIYDGMSGFMDSISYFQAHDFDVVDFVPVSNDPDDLCAVEMDCIMARKLR